MPSVMSQMVFKRLIIDRVFKQKHSIGVINVIKSVNFDIFITQTSHNLPKPLQLL